MIDALAKVDWDDIRVFLAVAREGSFARAARGLAIDVSTIGRRVRALEAALALRLFDRRPSELALTPAGMALRDAAAQMESGAAALLRRAQADAAPARQPVRVTATRSVAWFLTHHLGALAAAAPLAELSLVSTRERLSLARREAEIAIRMRRVPDRGDLSVRRIGRYGHAVYVRRGGDPNCVIGHVGDSALTQGRWFDGFARGRRVVARVDETFLRLQAARGGVGAALLPCYLGDGEPDLVRVPVPVPPPIEDVFLLVHNDLRAAPAVRQAADAITALFRRHARELAGG